MPTSSTKQKSTASPFPPVLALAALMGVGATPLAQGGYYASVDSSNPASLRASLHGLIDDHQRYPYSSGGTDTWDILEQADQDPANGGRILDLYRNASYAKAGGGNLNYNREHTWPNVYGFPVDNGSNYPYTDCHQLFLCDVGYNGSRGSKPFRDCGGCIEEPTVPNGGVGGGSGTYPGNSNWTTATDGPSGSWETWVDRRGDVARALFYLDVRYEGGTHGFTGAAEPDLVLTDDQALIAASATGQNESLAYMGMVSVLLTWHTQDPVDAKELARNQVVQTYQGNRNPFVDHPEWIDCLYNGSCGTDLIPPADVSGLSAAGGDGLVSLAWLPGGEPDLSGYNVYRSYFSGGPYNKLNGALVPIPSYSDTTVANGNTYFFAVTAVDFSGNESGLGSEVQATPAAAGSGGGLAWINELHYDNDGSDVGEFVEVAGPAGLDLAGYKLVGYNGNGGGQYGTQILSGVLPSQAGCLGASAFPFSGLQNGAPDGVALVDPTDVVLQFLSWEGSFSAVDGPAAGLGSNDIGVSELGSTPIGQSLQLGGSGKQAADFTWQAAQAETPGALNTGQTFSGGCGNAIAPAAPSGLLAQSNDGFVVVTWNANGEPDLAGYNLYRATVSGGPYTRLNGPLVGGVLQLDIQVTNGTLYHYAVAAVDTSGNESPLSSEDAALPVDPPTPFGCGINPTGSLKVLGGVPAVGTTITLGVDNPLGTQSPGAVPMVILELAPFPGLYPCGLPLNGLGMSGPLGTGELLVDLSTPVDTILIGAPWTGPGFPAPVPVALPQLPNLVGVSLWAQGLLADFAPPPGGVILGLANAVELAVGP